MAKDYIQDITPRDSAPKRPATRAAAPTPAPVPPPHEPNPLDIDEVEVPEPAEPAFVPERSIRNINVNRSRALDRSDRREVPSVGGGLPPRGPRMSLKWLWVALAIVAVLIAALSLIVFRKTTVTVIPRSHTIVFDSSKAFTAYPVGSAPAGSLEYSVGTLDLDDSQVVNAQGTRRAERKATGSITVVNEYSTTPLKYIKSTRFQTPDGLVYRVLSDITIPGMKGTSPGTVDVSVQADEAGDKYNIGPTARFNLPGLKGSAPYAKVYARSTQAFTGGFAGDEPAVEQSTLAAAVSEIRGRLQEKILVEIGKLSSQGTAFASMAVITYSDLPPTQEAVGQVRVNQRAHVEIPVFPAQIFNRVIAGSVSADVENSELSLIPKQNFEGIMNAATSTQLGQSPVSFTLSGTAQIVWNVDATSLTTALAGKEQGAFQTIVNGFQSIQEARARIEPFWSKKFPADVQKIQIVVQEPKDTQ